MAVVAEADKLRGQGIDVVDFGAGEPHFATPQPIKEAAIAAIQGNFTKYTAVAGRRSCGMRSYNATRPILHPSIAVRK